MTTYYNQLTEFKLYTQYQYDGLDFSSLNSLIISIEQKVISKGLILALARDSSKEEQHAACQALGNYLWHKVQ